jgi:hypothetical protein
VLNGHRASQALVPDNETFGPAVATSVPDSPYAGAHEAAARWLRGLPGLHQIGGIAGAGALAVPLFRAASLTLDHIQELDAAGWAQVRAPFRLAVLCCAVLCGAGRAPRGTARRAGLSPTAELLCARPLRTTGRSKLPKDSPRVH